MEPMDSVRVRRMRESDLPSAERASAVTFLEGDRSSRRVNEPEPRPRSAAESAGWIDRMSHFLATDPEGCWVAVDGPGNDGEVGDGGAGEGADGAGEGAGGADGPSEDRVVGFALSQNHGGLWILLTYGVLPGLQGRGIGKRLMDAVRAHAGDRQGMFISTVHPGATRRYWRAGFSLQPLMNLSGTVDRSTLPAVTGLREGGADDIGWMDRVDQEVRGAGRGPDHLHMQKTLRLIVSCGEDGRRGYVYTDDSGRAHLLAAQHPDTAQKLLWETLAQAPSGSAPQDRIFVTSTISASNHWAVDVGLAARLDLGQDGYLALRGMEAPAPYLPSGRFL
ncbi:GNAT family N-acetyltransferase [Streptomyces sp. NPDC048442]|uniref:GNAT family N-acetyltransferase n=1 Tax=Streptomyces sp. NPDC048442 TaxID=3154823 RepID=UPI003426D43A